MAYERLDRNNIGFWLIFPEQITDIQAITLAQLNNATYVKNITCALTEADTVFSLGESSGNDELTFCSKGNEASNGARTPTVTFTGLRDEDKNATGVFNLFRDLNLYPNVPYYALMRIGKRYDTAFTTTDKLFIVSVTTNTPLDVIADQTSVKLTQNYIPQGDYNWNFNPLAA